MMMIKMRRKMKTQNSGRDHNKMSNTEATLAGFVNLKKSTMTIDLNRLRK